MTNLTTGFTIEPCWALSFYTCPENAVEQRLARAQTLMLDVDLDGGEYRKTKAKLGQEIEALLRKQAARSDQKGCVDKTIQRSFELLRNLHKLFTSAGLEG